VKDAQIRHLHKLHGRQSSATSNQLDSSELLRCYVGMITEAGTDGYLVKHDPIPDNILNKIKISVQKHGSDRIFIVAHYDCAGHPVDEETHRKDIMASVDKIKKSFPDCAVSGLWLSEKWEVEKIVER
jgi:hypothetical protein